MLYRKHKAYILAIHGCKYWPSIGLGNGADGYIEDNFNTYHYAYGGTSLDCLQSVPSISEVIDATGGFGRLADASFELVDTHDDRFSKFFCADKVANGYSYLTEDLTYSSTSMVVNSTAAFYDEDDLCLPRETIRVGSVDTETEMAVTRGIYSAFTEGVWSSYNAVRPDLGAGADVVKGGHWNHAGRWVCLYESTSDETGAMSAPVRIYAGVIQDVNFNGRKCTIQTKSITSILSSPVILGVEYRLDPNFPNTLTHEMWMHNRNTGDMSVLDPALITAPFSNINSIIEQDLNFRALNQYNSKVSYQCSPGMIVVSENGTTLTDGAMPSGVLSHPAIEKFYRISDTVTYFGSAKTSGTSSEMSSDSEPVDTILVPGWQFKFDATRSVVPRTLASQFFLFNNELIVPCTYNAVTDVWTVDDDPATPWFDKDGNFITPTGADGREAQWLCFSKSSCVVKSVLCPSTSITLDLLRLIYQLMTSTGEAINPNETGDYSWWQSVGIPYYLVDYNTVATINYPLRPMITDNQGVVGIFEPSLKIAGWRCLFSFISGKIIFKQVSLPSANNADQNYLLASQYVEKPSTQIGYQAPLTSISFEFKRTLYINGTVGKKYTYNMSDSLSQFNEGLKLDLVDEWCTTEPAGVEANAYSYLYWTSTMVPSSVIKVTNLAGDVGDCITVTNKYVPNGAGYGITERAGIQTEVIVGYEHSIRVLFSGNTVTDEYGELAPSAEIDTSVGTYGVIDHEIFLVAGEFENDETFCQYVYRKAGTDTIPIMLVSYLGAFVYQDAILNLSTNTITMPADWDIPSMLIGIYVATKIWVTVPSYVFAKESDNA